MPSAPDLAGATALHRRGLITEGGPQAAPGVRRRTTGSAQ
jgi:hypothetical protein